MKIEAGKTRWVIIAGGIAIKFPQFYISSAIKDFFWRLPRGYKSIRRFFKYDFKWMFLGGIICNFKEFLFWREYKLSILAPTYFSLFGLINFQKAGIALPMEDPDVFCQLVDLTNKECWKDGHAFAEAANFCVLEGRAAMVDYGSSETQYVLKRYGKEIYRNFDLNFKWRKVKK